MAHTGNTKYPETIWNIAQLFCISSRSCRSTLSLLCTDLVRLRLFSRLPLLSTHPPSSTAIPLQPPLLPLTQTELLQLCCTSPLQTPPHLQCAFRHEPWAFNRVFWKWCDRVCPRHTSPAAPATALAPSASQHHLRSSIFTSATASKQQPKRRIAK